MALSQITAYNVGFGDCFLLRFLNNDITSFLLLDCGSCDLPLGITWEAIADDILTQLNDNKCNSICFMLTHLHEDHYNGFANVYTILSNYNIKVDTFYTSAILNDCSFQSVYQNLNDFYFTPICSSVKPHVLDDSITILWPPAPINQNQFQHYIKKHFPNCTIQNANLLFKKFDDGLSYNCDFWSIIFEVKGNNGKTYLFTGDFRNGLSVGSSSNQIDTLSHEIKNSSFKMIFKKNNKKYKMIKIPHHGTEQWPITQNLFAQNGYSLVSWGKYRTWKEPTLSKFSNVISTNYPCEYENPPCQNVFKITIDIRKSNDKVCFYSLNNTDTVPIFYL